MFYKRWALFVSLLILPESFACEDQPNPYHVLSEMDLSFKGYAERDDFKRYFKSLVDFEKMDKNKDGRITVQEIHIDQQEYQKRCEKIQNTEP